MHHSRGLEPYFSAIIATDSLILAVNFDLLVVNILFTRKNGINNLLAGDILYLAAREVKVIG